MGSGEVFPTLGSMPHRGMLTAAPGQPGHRLGEFSTGFFVQGQHGPSTGCGWGWQEPLQTTTRVPDEPALAFAGREAPERGVVGETQIAPNSRVGPSQRGQAAGELRVPSARDADAGGETRCRQPAHLAVSSPRACHLLCLPSHPANFNHGKLHLGKIESQQFFCFPFFFFFFFLVHIECVVDVNCVIWMACWLSRASVLPY